MLEIDKAIFDENLLLTQAYCELQLKNTYKNYASILRSFNPVYNGKEILSFELTQHGRELEAGYRFLINWNLDPLDSANDFLYDDLFEKQMKFKKGVISTSDQKEYNGRVLIVEIDSVIVDGISEFESVGFIDVNDCPPIDTWFYLTRKENSRVLFAWIPEPFEAIVEKGMEVNMLDIFHWYSAERPENSNWHAENLGEASKAAAQQVESPDSIFSQIKKLFS
jgi:hypothetical protein